jgi:rod shape determining protein RodA
MFDRRLIEYFDWGFLALIFLISFVGLVVLYSASAGSSEAGTLSPFLKKQIIWMIVGFMVMIILLIIDYRELDKFNLFLFVACTGLLLAVLIFGQIGGGSRRWISLVFFTLQPSELMKISLVISLAAVYSNTMSQTGLNFRRLLKPAVLCLIPFALIIDQPDLGTALLLILLAGSMTLFVKLEKKVFLILLGAGIMIIPLFWMVLKDYQKERILIFINPDRDPLGSGYHIIQSKIAIGSGMLTGKGFLKGTQNALSFLPEQHTDFIVSVLAEEWGLIGVSVLMLLYCILILWCFNIAYNCRNMFGSILAFGLTMMLVWQILINLGMVIGLLPVVGVPLPLVSYGGSSLISNMIALGILLNISMHKFLAN